MSRIYVLFICLFAFTLFSITTHAQWQWAAGCIHGAEGIGVTTDINGNIIATGVNYGNYTVFGTDTIPANAAAGGSVPVIVKYGPAGNYLWSHGVLGASAEPCSVTTDGVGNIYMLGTILPYGSVTIGTTTITPTATQQPYYIVKYDVAGNVKWVRTAGGKVNPGGFLGNTGGIVADSFGFIYIAQSFFGPPMNIGPYTLTSSGGNDIFMAKYDTSGNVVWAKNVGGSIGNDYINGLAISRSGGLYITGSYFSPTITFGSTTLVNSGSAASNSSLYLAKFDTAGNNVWAEGFGGMNEEVQGIAIDSQKELHIVGRFSQNTLQFGPAILVNPYTYPEIFITKFDSSGNELWAKGITTPAHILLDIEGFGITTDPCSNVWITARMDSMVYIDGTPVVNMPGYYDALLIAGFSSVGAPIANSVLKYGGDDISAIASDAAGNIFVCGDYGYGPFTVGSSTLSDSYPTLYEDLYVAKYASAAAKDTAFLGHIDTTACTGANITLTAPAGYSSYLWGNDSTGQYYMAHDTGYYWVYAAKGCSLFIDTFHVNMGIADTTVLTSDTVLCSQSVPITIMAPRGYASYLWNTGDTGYAVAISSSGTYFAIGQTGCDVLTDTMHVVIGGQVSLTNVTPDQTIAYGSSVQLNALGALYYLWTPDDGSLDNPNINNPMATPFAPTTYTVYGMDAYGCRDTARVAIGVTYTDVFIPSAFTPNGDGLNDIFHVGNLGFNKLVDMKIYNRWGEVVYSDDGSNRGWDGTFNGVPQDAGVFFYMIEIGKPTGANTVYKGDVTLIR